MQRSEDSTSPPSYMMKWALAYGRLGWRVFPTWWIRDGVCACPNGANCGAKAGKHPIVGGWTQEATADPTRITEWWTRWPDAHVSVATGPGTGVFVLDVDGPEGMASVEEYELRSVDGLPPTLTATTGSGGKHLFYRVPNGVTIKNSVKKVMPGVDVRGEGGQVVLPPSGHLSGGSYAWPDEGGPANLKAVAPPAELLELIGRSGSRSSTTATPGVRRAQASESDEDVAERGFPHGQRDTELWSWARSMHKRGVENWVELLWRGMQNCTPPYTDRTLEDFVAHVVHHEDAPLPGLDPAYQGFVDSLARRAEDRIAGRLPATDPAPAPPPRPATASAASSDVRPSGDDEDGDEGVTEGRLGADPDLPDGALFEMNDVGNAMRIQAIRGDDLIHADGYGWMCWDGHRWLKDEALATIWAQNCVMQHVKDREVTLAETEDGERKLMGWAMKARNAGRVNAALAMLKPMVHVGGDRDVFDSDPMLLSVANGTLELATGRLRGHRRSDRITHALDVEYVAGAACPHWDEFITLACPREDVRWFVQKAVGYSLTGLIDAKCFFMLHGPSNNGKSTFLDALREMLGQYASAADNSVFVQSPGQGNQHRTFLAMLAGKRFVTLSEFGQNDRFSPIVKEITGDGTIVANFMKQDAFQFTPQMKLWCGTNYQPQVTDFGPAMRKRPRVIEFTHSFEGSGVSRTEVLDRFRKEYPGILSWAVSGLQGYLSEGLEPVGEMRSWLDEWFSDDDLVGQFIRERCETWPYVGECDEWGVHSSSVSELYPAFVWWCGENGTKPPSRKTFQRDLKARTDVPSPPPRPGTTARYGIRARANNLT